MSPQGLTLTEHAGGVRFEVRAKPRAKKSAILGVREGVLHVSLAAPPAEGEANRELLETLADALGVPKRDVSLVRGASSRSKLVEVRGLTAEAVGVLLSGDAAPPTR